MVKNPYSDLPRSAFWKTGVAQENPYAIEGIYKKKFDIPANAKIATAGSCFAQHISRHLKKNGYNVLDVEPPPPGLPENMHQKLGFSMYSARYGNIYTVRQLLQLAKEVAGEWTPQNYIWEKNGKFYDALRPAVEPEGLDSPEDVIEERQFHISRVKELFRSLDLFIFTLGLTESWVHKGSGTVYPTAPGVLAGEFDEKIYEFQNSSYEEILTDFRRFRRVVKRMRGGKKFKIILTVSPVPLTATASGKHVLLSNTCSKSILRCVASELSVSRSIDYFPSYEIVKNPRMHSTAFADNLRSVRDEVVEIVMKHFFDQHNIDSIEFPSDEDFSSHIDLQCEEALLEEFSKPNPKNINEKAYESCVRIVGNSYTFHFMNCLENNIDPSTNTVQYIALPSNWLTLPSKSPWQLCFLDDSLDINIFEGEYHSLLIPRVNSINRYNLSEIWFIGGGFLGNNVLRHIGAIRYPSYDAGGLIIPASVKYENLPLISSKEEVDSLFPGFSSSILKNANELLHLIKACNRKGVKVKVVAAGIMSETSARHRYGDEFVDSCSFAVFANYALNLFDQVLHDYFEDGTLIVDLANIKPSGFSDDLYSVGMDPRDIHPCEDFYINSVRKLIGSD